MNIEKNIIDSKHEEAEKELNTLLKSNSDNSFNTVIIYTYYVNMYCSLLQYDKALEFSNLSKEISDKTPDKLDDAYTNYSFTKIYLLNQVYDKTIKHANLTLQILKNYPKEYKLYADTYSLMTISHSRMGTYNDQYKIYAEQALKYSEKTNNPINMVASYSAVMYMYYNRYMKSHLQTDLDEVYHYAKLTLEYTINDKYKKYMPIKAKVLAYNNLASMLNSYPNKSMSDTERYQLAEQYIEKSIEISKTVKIPELLASCYTTYAEIQESKGDLSQAEIYYLKAYDEIKNSVLDIKTKKEISQLLASFYGKRNNINEELKYYKLLLEYTKQLNEKASEDKSKFLEAYYNAEQKNHEIQQLKSTNSLYLKQRVLFTIAIITSIIGVIFLIYIIRYKQKLNKQKTDLLEAENVETSLSLKLEKEEKTRLKLEQELLALQQEQLQKQALATSIELSHKKSVLKDLKEKILDEKNPSLDRYFKNERIIENDFDNIQRLIKDIHPNFYRKLNDIAKTNLTNLDLKYCAYIYLNIDNQQIANLLKVEQKTVRMAKYRLKQKIGLQKTTDLSAYIQNLEL
ncbi:transcriptional regulator [Empedobacter sedimenti]|uniref:transcriptional regulator n=1 Tax=Empedobacter sedimenti TaxID=3042610 RepID=UPI0024A744B8|nr:tetratricopeptide repeat protein [Empedobacter sedimenti]